MFYRPVLAALAVLGAAAPALAQPIVVSGHPVTFQGLEYGYSGQDRIAEANAYFHDAIPAGSSASDARALLTKAGAHCADRNGAQLRCTANSFEAVDDMLHDVSWTVKIDRDGDAVTGLSVDRASIGS
jgi:hypothetical protein